jgi:hypothetical protein
MLICPSCRWSHELRGSFCVRCGQELPAPLRPLVDAPLFRDLAQSQPRSRAWMIVVGVVGGIVGNILVAIGDLLLALSLSGPSEAIVVIFLVLLAGQLFINVLLIRRWMKSETKRGYGIGLLTALVLLGSLIFVLLLLALMG